MSTGMISLSSMSRMLSESLENPKPHALFWDEPDVGLADEAALGVANMLVDYFTKVPQSLIGIFIITHRKTILERLVEINPMILFLGPEIEKPKTLQRWLNRSIKPWTPKDVISEGVTLWTLLSDFEARLRKGK